MKIENGDMKLTQSSFILLVIVIMLIGCFELSNASIMAEELSTIPNNCYNMNNTTLDKYPQLSKIFNINIFFNV